jgi:hypothetical protein
VGIDCSQEEPYSVDVIYAFDGEVGEDLEAGTPLGTEESHWFKFNDQTPTSRASGPDMDASASEFGVRPIEGGRCGNNYALLLTQSGRNDWGGAFGNWNIVSAGHDASGQEGLSFWARAPFDKSITVVLDDNTSAARLTEDPPDSGTFINNGECDVTDLDAAVIIGPDGAVTTPEGRRDGGANLAAYDSGVAGPNDCGNSFTRPLVLSARWEFYTLPFSSFAQIQQPNLSPEGINSSAIHGILFRIPKASKMELWLDDIGFYRRR